VPLALPAVFVGLEQLEHRAHLLVLGAGAREGLRVCTRTADSGARFRMGHGREPIRCQDGGDAVHRNSRSGRDRLDRQNTLAVTRT